jgi:ketosteroid isomerase-like protein
MTPRGAERNGPLVHGAGPGRGLDEASELVHDDFVVHEPPGLPYGGDYHGVQAFFELLHKIDTALELTPLSVEHLEPGDTVLARTLLRFTSRASGQRMDIRLTNIFSLRDDRIAELDVYYEDPSAIGTLLAQTPLQQGAASEA